MGSFLIYPLNDILLTKNILLLTESEKSLLCKGLILATPPKTLEYAEFYFPLYSTNSWLIIAHLLDLLCH